MIKPTPKPKLGPSKTAIRSAAGAADMQRKARLSEQRRRRPPLVALTYEGDPLATVAESPAEGLGVLNQMIEAVEATVAADAESPELKRYKGVRADIAVARKRQEDVSYYTVVVFNDKAECDAFLRVIKDVCALDPRGDLFIDGRALVAGLKSKGIGIDLPPPAYDLAKVKAEAPAETSITRKHPKIRKGARHDG